jgi:hypothetical protein
MYKYEKKIKDLGLNKSGLPKSIAGPIKELEDAIAEMSDLQKDLSELEEGDESRGDIENEIAEYQKIIAEADEDLVVKIQTYVDKKPYYDEKYKHMRQAAEAKKQAKAQPQPAPSPAPAPEPEPEPEPAPETIIYPQPYPETKKEDDGIGSWLLWGGLGVIGILVGVNVWKNRK